MSIDDATLMAFADGELSETRAAEVAAAVAADPALAARAERFRTVRAKLAGSLDGLAPPPDLLARAERASADRETRRVRPLMIAMAASAVVGIGLGWYIPRDGRPGFNSAIGPDMRTRGTLAVALSRTPSGAERAIMQAKVRPVFTARAADGQVCRAFRLVRTSETFEGVACRERFGWRMVVLAQVPPRPAGFGQASGDEAPAVAAALDALDLGDPLSEAAEQALIERRWRE